MSKTRGNTFWLDLPLGFPNDRPSSQFKVISTQICVKTFEKNSQMQHSATFFHCVLARCFSKNRTVSLWLILSTRRIGVNKRFYFGTTADLVIRVSSCLVNLKRSVTSILVVSHQPIDLWMRGGIIWISSTHFSHDNGLFMNRLLWNTLNYKITILLLNLMLSGGREYSDRLMRGIGRKF